MPQGVEKREYESFPAGEFAGAMFGAFTKKDDNGIPILVPDKNNPARLKVFYNVEVPEHDCKAPGTLYPFEAMEPFIRAWGGNPDEIKMWLPMTPENASQVLSLVEDMLTRAADGGFSTTIRVNEGGFINSVDGLNLPPGKRYTFRFVRVYTTTDSGIPTWVDQNAGKEGREPWYVFGVEMMVTAGKYAGMTGRGTVDYGIKYDAKTNTFWQPTNSRTQEYTKGAQRFNGFVDNYAPTLNFSDPKGFEDVGNVVPEIASEAARLGRLATIKLNDKGYMDFDTVEPLDEDQQPVPGTTPPQVASPVATPTKSLSDLQGELRAQLSYLFNLSNGENDEVSLWLGDAGWKFSDAGKPWAREKVLPLVMKLGMGTEFAKFTAVQIPKLLTELDKLEAEILAVPGAAESVADDFS